MGANDEAAFSPMIRAMMHAFKSERFVQALELLTGIKPLLVDVANFGAGPMQIFANGSLQVHADFNRHPTFAKWERRVVIHQEIERIGLAHARPVSTPSSQRHATC